MRNRAQGDSIQNVNLVEFWMQVKIIRFKNGFWNDPEYLDVLAYSCKQAEDIVVSCIDGVFMVGGVTIKGTKEDYERTAGQDQGDWDPNTVVELTPEGWDYLQSLEEE